MLKSNKGHIEIDGNLIVIRAEFISLGRAIIEAVAEAEGKHYAEEIMRSDIEDIFKSEDELIEDVILKMCERIIERKEKKNGRNEEN